jgi:hypothetical protein
MQESYKYFAFISFQSADAKEALWVQKAIENYRLPTAVSKTRSLPKRMRPCFCYLNDINLSEELMMELKQRMEQSEYLIVICSPRSAKSSFVNGGINYFVQLGRRDRIIPLIVDGLPYSGDPETECFPEALRRHFPKSADPMQDHQILGVNVNEEGAGSRRWKRQRAVLLVIARMLGLEFENLWNREVKRRKKQRAAIAAIVAGVLCLLGLTWHFSRSVDVAIEIAEASMPVDALPACTDGQISLQLNNEEKEKDSVSIGETVIFRNIPRRFVGREVQCKFSGSGYKSIDTTLTLRTKTVLPVTRDEHIYGHIRFRLRGVVQPEKTVIRIAGQELKADKDGLVETDVPLEEQQTAYSVEVNGKVLNDSIYTPCGENDIIMME